MIMKKPRFFVEVLFVSLLFVLMPATVKAAMWDVPVGPGEKFRWVFVTSSVTTAISTDIGDYNMFVDGAAAVLNPDMSEIVGMDDFTEIEWRAIASTATVHAIDNIGESSSGIYNPMGVLVANGTADMFDGDIASPISLTELGGPPPDPKVWTGTDASGYGSGYVLGSVDDFGIPFAPADIGEWIEIDNRWIQAGDWMPILPLPLYAISEELTVVPAPGALILAATGLLSSTLGLKRLRRKHQE